MRKTRQWLSSRRAGARICLVLTVIALLGTGCGRDTGGPVPQLPANGESRVVLLMLDGVRRREFFGRPDRRRAAAEQERTGQPLSRELTERRLLENLHRRWLDQALVYGRPDSRVRFASANAVMKSLPAYQSIFLGYGSTCFANDCGAIRRESFLERFEREVSSEPHAAAVIASWVTIKDAVRGSPGAAFVSTGTGFFPELDATHRAINDTYAAPPWGNARTDEQTFAHGLHYLLRQQPRFLFLSLNDADEWAHLNDYTRYVETIAGYDRRISQLAETLENLPGENWLFMTTDHDRGPGRRWVNHGYELAAVPIWLVVLGPLGRGVNAEARRRAAEVQGPRVTVATHLDLRPTFELLLGLKPNTCALCGLPLPAVAERALRSRASTTTPRRLSRTRVRSTTTAGLSAKARGPYTPHAASQPIRRER